MAMHVPRAPGFSSMMKDGARFFSGLEEAVIRYVLHIHRTMDHERVVRGKRQERLFVISFERNKGIFLENVFWTPRSLPPPLSLFYMHLIFNT